MSSKTPRVKLLTGAPLAKNLKWDDQSLNVDLLPAIEIIGYIIQGTFPPTGLDVYNAELIKTSSNCNWRTVSKTSSTRLRTGDTQSTSFLQYRNEASQSFNDPAAYREGISLPSIPASSTSTTSINSDFSPEYIRHSFKLDERIRPSHLSQTSTTEDITSFRSGLSFTSFLSTNPHTSFLPDTSFLTSTSHPVSTQKPPLLLPPNLSPTPLNALPTAKYLSSLAPQTPTHTLLVAIISCTPRLISIKHRPTRTNPVPPNTERTVLDILVGDSTRAGFKCSFWLPPTKTSAADSEHISSGPLDLPLAHLPSLRRGTVVLVHRIALTAYAGVVYGQSLNPYLTKQRTCVDVIMDEKGGMLVDVGDERWRERIVGVREWVEGYVGLESRESRGRKRKSAEMGRMGERGTGRARRVREDLPPDDSMVMQ